MMFYWRALYKKEIFEVDYELLVSNPKQEVKKIFSYLGLEFNEVFLEISNNKRSVTTASDLQIRNKINSNGIDSWKKYSSIIEKFTDEFNSNSQL